MKTVENINLIRKLAWSFNSTTGIDYQELVGEATLAYYEALNDYDNTKGAKSTSWCYLRVKNHLINYCKREKRIKTDSLDGIPDPVQTVKRDFDIEVLFTGKAKEMVVTILELANDYTARTRTTGRVRSMVKNNHGIDFELTSKSIKSKLRKYFIQLGWKPDEIMRVYNEITLILNSN